MDRILNHLTDCIIIVDQQGRIQFANSALYERLGYKQQELQHTFIDQIIDHETPLGQYLAKFSDEINTWGTIKNKSGTDLECKIIINKEQWKMKDALFIQLDLEHDSLYTKKDLERFLDGARVDVCIKNEEGRYIYINETYAKRLNKSREDVLGKYDKDFWEPVYCEQFAKDDCLVRESESSIISEEVIELEENTQWYETYKFPIIDKESQRKYVGITIKDITLNKKIEMELFNRLNELITPEQYLDKMSKSQEKINTFLKDMEEDLLRYLAAAGVSIWIYDEGKNQLTLHTKLGEAAYTLRDVQGLDVSKEDLYQFKQSPQEGEISCFEERTDILYKQEGLEQGIKYIGTYSINYNNEVLGILSITYKEMTTQQFRKNDIMKTFCAQLGLIINNQRLKEDIKKEIEKSKSIERLKQEEKIKNEFFANISHEFKTPLNIILATMQLMERASKDESIVVTKDIDFNKYIYNIRQNSYRLLRLVNNLIDITRIDIGYYYLQLENHNIVSIVEDITLSVVEYTKEKGITLIFDTEVEEEIIACDPDKIERIMLNLLSNAVKYSDEQGGIEVMVRIVSDKILISVKDYGDGIPEEKLESIFERFVQVDRTLARKCEGSGIGLSLTKALVDMHGGNIYAKSKLREGTEFIVELPRVQIEGCEKIAQIPDLGGVAVERCKVEFSDIYSG